MIYALAIIGLILISLHLYRQYWLYKTLEQASRSGSTVK